MAFRVTALRHRRVLDGPAQAVQPVGVEEIAGPLLCFTRSEVPALTLHQELLEPSPYTGVDLIEFLGRVTGAEVVAPASEHGVDGVDQDAYVLDPGPVTSFTRCLTRFMLRTDGQRWRK